MSARPVVLGLLVLLLVGCGGYRTQTSGLEEETLLVLRGERLVGLQVDLGSTFSRTISQSDLTDYPLGVAGAADKEVETLQTVTLLVASGPQRIVVSRDGQAVMDRELYFSRGQARELRIRR